MRPEKQLLLDDLKSKVESHSAFIVTKYIGFVAEAISGFRDEIYKVGGDFEVVPKRVFIKAAEENGVELDPNSLEGHIGIVFAKEDVIETTKVVTKFSKTNKEVLEIICGHIDGHLYDADKVLKLSELPSKDAMRAQFVGLLQAPMAQTLGTFQALLTSVIFCLDNKAKKDQE